MLEVRRDRLFAAHLTVLNHESVSFIIVCLHNPELQEEELKSAILVVLANKQDIEGAMSVTEVIWSFVPRL